MEFELKVAVFLYVLMLIIAALAFAWSADACVNGSRQIYNTKYVYHDTNCNGTTDMIYEYHWNGKSWLFMGSYPAG